MHNEKRTTRSIGLTTILLAGLFANLVMADSNWTGFGHVLALQSHIDGEILVQVDVNSNPSRCKEKQWFHLGPWGKGSQPTYQLLLEAALNGKRVRLSVTELCHLNGYSQITAVALLP